MRIDLVQETVALYKAAKPAGDDDAGIPSVHYVAEGNVKASFGTGRGGGGDSRRTPRSKRF